MSKGRTSRAYLGGAWELMFLPIGSYGADDQRGHRTRHVNFSDGGVSCMPITDRDIEDYLHTRSDFDLELFVYRTLQEHGCPATHGGTYVDPVSQKARQYDIRAIWELHKGHAKLPICRLALAIECKNLSSDAPLLVSRVPRPPEDAYHELMHSWQRQNARDKMARILNPEGPSALYRPGDPTAKRTAQVCRLTGGGFKDDDRDPYEKWSQALASAADLIRDSVAAASDSQQALSLILPVLVVSDGTLWAADYSQDGTRNGLAHPIDGVELFVNREYAWEIMALPEARLYRISHLHIYTRTGFATFVKDFSRPGRLRERMFEFGLQQLLG